MYLFQWSKALTPFPYQTTLQIAAILDKDEKDIGVEKDLEEVFYFKREVFLYDEKNYGEFGLVSFKVF